MNTPGYNSSILANVLKKKKMDRRCIELIKTGGDKVQFDYVFDKLKAFLETKFEETISI